jgi:hypothetical protein
MVNPLRGFISENRRLFERFDDEGEGIELYEPQSIQSMVRTVLEILLGKTVRVTSGGDTIVVNKQSAEAFFERNANKFSGAILSGMSLPDKLFRLVELSRSSFIGLPRGLLEEYARGGAEGKKMVVGLVPQFMALIDSLEQNHGFSLPKLRELIFTRSETGYLEFDRDELFAKILEENVERVGELSATSGRPVVRRLAALLMSQLKSQGREKNG